MNEDAWVGATNGLPSVVPIGCIDVDIGNVRSRMHGIEELAASIRAHGVLQPLIGTRRDDGRIQLIAGHRRLEASRVAGLTHVPVVIKDASESVAKEIQLIENVQREDLPALDVAEALMTMSKTGQTAEAIAGRVGKSAAWVRRHLALLKLDAKVVEALRKHGLRFTQAEQVARVLKTGSLDAALEAAKAMAAGQLSRRSSERSITDETKYTSVKQSFTWAGDDARATLTIESKVALDAVRSRQLQGLIDAVERIIAEAA